MALANARKRRRWRRLVLKLWHDDDWQVPAVVAALVLQLLLLAEDGSEPPSQEISQLARRIQDPFLGLTGGDTTLLINLFHTVLVQALPEQDMAGKELIYYATAAAGLLLGDAPTELAQLRPTVHEYWVSVVPEIEEELGQSRQGEG
jgi:hypothetical protein